MFARIAALVAALASSLVLLAAPAHAGVGGVYTTVVPWCSVGPAPTYSGPCYLYGSAGASRSYDSKPAMHVHMTCWKDVSGRRWFKVVTLDKKTTFWAPASEIENQEKVGRC